MPRGYEAARQRGYEAPGLRGYEAFVGPFLGPFLDPFLDSFLDSFLGSLVAHFGHLFWAFLDPVFGPLGAHCGPWGSFCPPLGLFFRGLRGAIFEPPKGLKRLKNSLT